MNRNGVAIGLSTVGAIAGSMGVATFSSAQILNGGFETGFVTASGSAQLPTPWTSTAPGNIFVSFDTWASGGGNGLPPWFAGVFTGVVAAQGKRWAGGWNFENMHQQMAFTLTPGQQYTISALVHAPNAPFGYVAGGWRFKLGPTGAAGTTTIATFAPTVTWSMGWVLQSATFTAPANAGSLQYFFPEVYKTGNLNTYMGIDDIRITPVPGAGPLALLGLGGAACVSRRRR